MSVFYPYKMERGRRSRGREFAPSPFMEMKNQVIQITRLHQLAEVEEMEGFEKEAGEIRHVAVRRGIQAIIRTELNALYKHALDGALEWLRRRDYEMHKLVTGTIEQAQAARSLEKRVRKPGIANGNI